MFSQNFRKQSQDILIDGKVFVVIVRHVLVFASILPYRCKQYVANACESITNKLNLITINSHYLLCEVSLVSVILLANRMIFGEFAANIKCVHSQGYSPLCESSIRYVARYATCKWYKNNIYLHVKYC